LKGDAQVPSTRITRAKEPSGQDYVRTPPGCPSPPDTDPRRLHGADRLVQNWLGAAWDWARRNFFNTWYNSILTVAILYLLYTSLRPALHWALTEARWEVIPANLQPLLIGTYPRSQGWRIWAIAHTLLLLSGLSAGAFGARVKRASAWTAVAAAFLFLLPLGPFSRSMIALGALLLTGGLWIGASRIRRRRWLFVAWFLSFPWTLFLMWGVRGSETLPRVETSWWGGLVLTLVLAVVGIAGSLPIGILLALGRRSDLPVISWCCTAFIEVVRGTPLVAVIFMAHLLVPVFLPDFRIDKVVRAMMGLTLFTSAYMAENVRGGLQSVPKGQYEAAYALGMNGTLTMLLVILPQALRSVIPSIIGQFISLFKDTSLVAIIGLLDLLGIARSVIANPAWLGLQVEVFLFAAFVYWSFSFTLSRSSRRIEQALGVGPKR